MQVRMSEEEMTLVHELVQDALIDEARSSQGFEEEVVDTTKATTQKMREILLERLERKLRQ